MGRPEKTLILGNSIITCAISRIISMYGTKNIVRPASVGNVSGQVGKSSKYPFLKFGIVLVTRRVLIA